MLLGQRRARQHGLAATTPRSAAGSNNTAYAAPAVLGQRRTAATRPDGCRTPRSAAGTLQHGQQPTGLCGQRRDPQCTASALLLLGSAAGSRNDGQRLLLPRSAAGRHNTASGYYSSVSGGFRTTRPVATSTLRSAAGETTWPADCLSSVSGGYDNTASRLTSPRSAAGSTERRPATAGSSVSGGIVRTRPAATWVLGERRILQHGQRPRVPTTGRRAHSAKATSPASDTDLPHQTARVAQHGQQQARPALNGALGNSSSAGRRKRAPVCGGVRRPESQRRRVLRQSRCHRCVNAPENLRDTVAGSLFENQ